MHTNYFLKHTKLTFLIKELEEIDINCSLINYKQLTSFHDRLDFSEDINIFMIFVICRYADILDSRIIRLECHVTMRGEQFEEQLAGT